MLITADQLLLHGIGDYVLQSSWMADNKTKRSFPAAAHALVYSLPFLILIPSPLAFAVILLTHFLIDRFRLARYLVWAKNWLGMWRLEPLGSAIDRANELGEVVNQRRVPPTTSFADCYATGYPSSMPAWMSVWLLIIADNIMHVLINGLALKYL